MPDTPPTPRTPCFCKLNDCYYWEQDPTTDQIFCTHMDKAMNLRVEPCPLYRLDWKKRQELMRMKSPGNPKRH